MEGNNKGPRYKLKCASQAEILRSHQRDDEFIKDLREKLLDAILFFGKKSSLLRYVHSDTPFRLLYFIFTSGMGNQTLGEEYTGLVQAQLKAHKVPSLATRILGAILECFGERGLLHLLKRTQTYVNDPRSGLLPSAALFLNTFLSKLCNILPTLILLHKGLFYIYGRYYTLAKRVVGIDYAKVYGRRPTDSVSWGLRILGLATLAQCVLKIWQTGVDQEVDDKSVVIDESHAKLTCQLCLGKMPNTTTPCGHLYCWECISDWLSKKPQCPLCREHVAPSRIVYIMNL